MSEMELQSDLLMVLLYTLVYFSVVTVFSMFLFRRGAKEVRGILTTSAVGGSTPFSFPLIEAVWGPQAVSLALFLDLPNAFMLFCVNFMPAAYLAPNTDLTPASIPANQIQPSDRSNAAALTSRKRPNSANIDPTGERYMSAGRAHARQERKEEEEDIPETRGLICGPQAQQAWLDTVASVRRIDCRVMGSNLMKVSGVQVQ
jgi:hypothetical protein